MSSDNAFIIFLFQRCTTEKGGSTCEIRCHASCANCCAHFLHLPYITHCRLYCRTIVAIMYRKGVQRLPWRLAFATWCDALSFMLGYYVTTVSVSDSSTRRKPPVLYPTPILFFNVCIMRHYSVNDRKAIWGRKLLLRGPCRVRTLLCSVIYVGCCPRRKAPAMEATVRGEWEGQGERGSYGRPMS